MLRIIQNIIQKELNNRKVALIIGQRQTGKTFELKRLLEQEDNVQFYDLEDEAKRSLFLKASVDVLEKVLGPKEDKRVLLLDEVQCLPKAGSILKLIHDHFINTKVIGTGSASFLLLKNMGDSLYGRHFIFYLFPLTLREMVDKLDWDQDKPWGSFDQMNKKPKIDACLSQVLIYGSLPEIYLTPDLLDKERLLESYVDSLLFKDIFELEGIRNPQVFKKLLRLLAYQISSEVNPNELAAQLSLSRATVLEYIALYEKFQIIKTLSAFNTNQRKEVSKKFKVYFLDLGIRNTLIKNYVPFSERNDQGALFENFCVMNFLFLNHYFSLNYEAFFWRNYNGAEVDLVLKNTRFEDKLIVVEIKYNKDVRPSEAFYNLYADQVEQSFCITKDNMWKFV